MRKLKSKQNLLCFLVAILRVWAALHKQDIGNTVNNEKGRINYHNYGEHQCKNHRKHARENTKTGRKQMNWTILTIETFWYSVQFYSSVGKRWHPWSSFGLVPGINRSVPLYGTITQTVPLCVRFGVLRMKYRSD